MIWLISFFHRWGNLWACDTSKHRWLRHKVCRFLDCFIDTAVLLLFPFKCIRTIRIVTCLYIHCAGGWYDRDRWTCITTCSRILIQLVVFTVYIKFLDERLYWWSWPSRVVTRMLIHRYSLLLSLYAKLFLLSNVTGNVMAFISTALPQQIFYVCTEILW